MTEEMSSELNRVTEEFLGGTPESRLVEAMEVMDRGYRFLKYSIREESC